MDCLKDWFDAEVVPRRTQLALAKELDVSPPTVNEWVHGESNPSSKRLHALHLATGISIERLISDCARDAKRRKREQTAA
jgi:transcriptional regulator with XRE-family HTH domain